MVNRPVYLGIRLPSGTHDQIFLSETASFLLWYTLYNERMGLYILLFHLTPQPRGWGPHIYIPQEQGGPVIPLGTGFPFHHLLNMQG
jgi:hypothetical protein